MTNDFDERKTENMIRKVISSGYEKMGYPDVDTFGVNVNDKGITVCINSEVPFLDARFFIFLDSIKVEIKKIGYRYVKQYFVSDYCFIIFEK